MLNVKMLSQIAGWACSHHSTHPVPYCTWYLRLINLLDSNGQNVRNILVLAVDETGQRSPAIEKQADTFFWKQPGQSSPDEIQLRLLSQMEEILEREIKQRFGNQSDHPYSAKLVSWIST